MVSQNIFNNICKALPHLLDSYLSPYILLRFYSISALYKVFLDKNVYEYGHDGMLDLIYVQQF